MDQNIFLWSEYVDENVMNFNPEDILPFCDPRKKYFTLNLLIVTPPTPSGQLREKLHRFITQNVKVDNICMITDSLSLLGYPFLIDKTGRHQQLHLWQLLVESPNKQWQLNQARTAYQPIDSDLPCYIQSEIGQFFGRLCNFINVNFTEFQIKSVFEPQDSNKIDYIG